MIRANKTTSRRTGFTLVEVLVVIAIIAILVSLTAAAVFKIYGKGDELIARHDISNLATAVEAYKQKFNVDWLPSRFRLREDLYGYALGIASSDQLDIESWAYLKKLFPKLPSLPAAPGVALIDWNNNGVPDAAVDLEGHQCLVFFLGGIPAGPFNGQVNGVMGFSTNPSNPAAPGGERIGPFYRDFKADRLNILQTPPLVPMLYGLPVATNSTYFSYMDPWGANPYAYFSTYKKVNGYNRYGAGNFGYYFGTGTGQLGLAPNSVSDNTYLIVQDRATSNVSSPMTTVYPLWPYALNGGNGNAVYNNKDTYQIISSGPDKVFGQGTTMAVTIVGGVAVWTPTPSNSTWSPQQAGNQTLKGRDDFSNFHDRQLGSGD
jgi:prepilin-type N-terminal cleavage/methylation domain-containing protein